MRPSIQTARVLGRVGCLVLLVVGVALLPVWAREATPQEGRNEAEVARLQPLADQGVIPQDRLIEARNEVELLEAQLEVQKTAVEEAAVRFKLAKVALDRIEQVARTGAAPESRLVQAREQVEVSQAQLKVKQAEQRVAEVRLNQARQLLARLEGTKEKVAPKPGDKEKSALLEARLKAARQTYELLIAAWQRDAGGASDPEQVYLWSRRWLEAQRDLTEKQTDQVAALEAHRTRIEQLEKLARKLREAGVAGRTVVAVAEFYRLEAELWLVEAKSKKGHDHAGWWCEEHGLPEEMCSLCSDRVAIKCKLKGDWCDKHDRAKSQCFKCDPKLKEKYAAMYRARYGKEPPPIEEEKETPKKEEKK